MGSVGQDLRLPQRGGGVRRLHLGAEGEGRVRGAPSGVPERRRAVPRRRGEAALRRGAEAGERGRARQAARRHSGGCARPTPCCAGARWRAKAELAPRVGARRTPVHTSAAIP